MGTGHKSMLDKLIRHTQLCFATFSWVSNYRVSEPVSFITLGKILYGRG